jgi:Lon protease-like protein
MISTEMLTNLGSLILPLENEDKQKLLELNDIELRLEVLCQFLDSELKVESDLINFNQIIPTNINWN